jgi:hypothetical protein
MNQDWDDQIRDALQGYRDLEPRDEDIAAALGAPPRRGGPSNRAIALLAALVLVLGGTTAAVPPARSAVKQLLGQLNDFFAGGDAPGPALQTRRPTNDLYWLGEATPGSPRILAQEGKLRLIGYRQKKDGLACISYGPSVNECANGADWRSRFAGRRVVPLITTTLRGSPGRVLWGIAEDNVARVSLKYDVTETLDADVQNNGFIIVAPLGRVPQSLVGYDSDGKVVATVPVRDLQWTAPCTNPNGC